ncbi:LOW QUALITY PROTEIN: disintegrin and metalloproteinase domain-containing protein 23-like [Brienomyrus brachyistius]|uniref:LOW QUALITY PROTEIN: disintegrin and metalloproteinase domain-containing protein 23-like n=1 Tax=Brienomyrus brachyistius TaxID=42636 RepID=UPI0020B33505|nr:LOW QUALITY PROTEIN: disintegrin and metalloproteinase domain-containing protein 23-like [Brienomyrus brachyistius]
MYLIFVSSLLASILVSWLSVIAVASTVTSAVENEFLKAATSPGVSSDNSTRHRVACEVTYPSRLIYYLNEDSESTYHDLDTKTRNQDGESQVVHLSQASFKIEAFGSRFILDLTLNNDLLSSDYVEIHYEDGGKPVLSKGGEHCYYHGHVRGGQDSHVALSTCNGLHGMFDDGNYVYIIEPLQQTHLIDMVARPHSLCRSHTLQWARDPDSLTDEEMLLSSLTEMSWLRRRKKRAMPRSVFEEMKYLELMIVADHNMYKRHKTKQHTKNFAKSVVNLVDGIFKDQLHTRVVLVGMEIWTERDQIPISVRPLEMLRDFAKYRQHSIKQHADAVQLFSNVTFHYRRSSAAYFGGVCSSSRGVGVNEYGNTWTMAASLLQSLAQNLGIQWDPAIKRKDCGCGDSWVGCIMEDTGIQHPRMFSKCSISNYKEFLLKGGGSCLFNRPNKLFEATECGNGYVEVGEECDCGLRTDCLQHCCKKCSLANSAHCSDGPCCNNTCLFFPRGFTCRFEFNDCDISETCTGDSGQCPPNLHKQDGYACHLNQGRCYAGECKNRESQCRYVWGPNAGASEKFCYEKLNTEGTEKGNCGKDGEKWIPCSKHDVFCGYLLCTNIGRTPRIGQMKGDITPTSFNHQARLVDCSGGHVLLDDETDLGYVEDGTPCGPSMMCLDRKCLPIQSLNMSACPSGSNGQVCSAHGVCNNEAACSCDATWAGTDCSMSDPPKTPPPKEDEGPKGPSATNLIIGSIAGAILVAAIVLGGTGWGFKNVKKRRYDPNASAI